MPLRKVLLYGGCHALILRDLLLELFPDKLATTLIINFELIRRGEPFPFERLPDFDVVFYSPIENKGDYNTSNLTEACRTLGVDAICFPWLEWHGYCPGASKGNFKNRFQWHYGGLVEAASSFDSFERFVDWTIESYPDDATIDAVFARSTAMVRQAEERHDMSVRISDFIIEHHRHSRLFLISDHPSLSLYLHVLRQMLDLLRLTGDSELARAARELEEPQWRWRTPILPRVAKRLDLRFRDTNWIDDDVVPGRRLDLRSFLLLYYHSDSVILGPIEAASISLVGEGGAPRRIEATTRLVADRLCDRSRDIGDEYSLLQVLSAGAVPLERNQRFAIDETQWRIAWG